MLKFKMSQLTDYATIKILFFARAREFTGKKEILIEVPRVISGKNLLNFIIEKFKLDQLKCNVILALNENWIDLNSDLCLKDNDEVAIIPPLSGGKEQNKQAAIMDWVKLTTDELSIESIHKMVCSAEFGAVSIFVGTTRNSFEGRAVIKLEYEAYEGMAVKSLKNICQNIREKFDVGNIAIFHRLGEVPIEEVSVVIAISSVHRKAALEALPYATDALKAIVPIWKKEVYGDGKSAQWKENSECAWSKN